MATRISKRLAWLSLAGLLAIDLAIWWTRSRPDSTLPLDTPTASERAEQAAADRYSHFMADMERIDHTVWGKELLAERCGQTFDSLWDRLNAATNKLDRLAAFPLGQIVLGAWNRVQSLPHGIDLREPTGPGPVLSAAQWRQRVEAFAHAGWRLEQIEFRHVRFDTDAAGRPCRSDYWFSAHLLNPTRPERAIVEGSLVVDWSGSPTSGKPPGITRIDVSHLTIKTRRGSPPFQLILNQTITPAENRGSIDPLIVHDLDGDGRSEVILAANNLVFRPQGRDQFVSRPLCRYPRDRVMTAVIADFDGDGFADFLCATAEGLVLFKGSAGGAFDIPGRLVWAARPPLKNAMALTCGDIDHDGDLDIFLGQYKVPALGEMTRPHYYEANDGYPAYLLLNDGHGNFTDATATAGLEKKRWRRTYSASFVDLDNDGNLDLVVVSDFAGVDLYRNDSRGHFTDVTQAWVDEPHAFGMSAALADFNDDGRLDLLMIGMPSPTVDRLAHLGLWRPGIDPDPFMRRRMTFGNRLYLARPGGGFEQTSMNDSIARSGWAWGCAAFDFDNDGFPDVYIANGQQSKQSVREYEREWWLHDLYVGDAVDDATATRYFMEKFARTRGAGWSYGGYEKNRLYLNQGGRSFVEIGYLMGVSLEEDCRNVVADDLDGDGRMDLLVTTFEVWPQVKQTLRVYKNNLSDAGHWIGFRFPEGPGNPSPIGARVTIHYDGRSATRQIVTGDSYRSQHANTVHFGLGNANRVERVEIRWPDGRTLTLLDPAVDRYHATPRIASSLAPRLRQKSLAANAQLVP